MVKSKIIALVLACCAALSVTAYAVTGDPWAEYGGVDPIYLTEGSEEPSETVQNEPESTINDEGVSTLPEEETENIDDSELNSEGSENLVVDISDESIQAIAEAVNASSYQYNYQYSIPLSTGNSIVIDTNIENLLDDYHVIINNYGGSCYFWVHPDDIKFHTSLNTWLPYKNVFGVFIGSASKLVNGFVYSFESYESLSYPNVSVGSSPIILFSNRHILKNDGSVLFESTFVPPIEYTITFDTGFDDVVIDSQVHTAFVLPPDPVKTGYIFTGWYLDSEFTTIYTSDYVFTADTTLYASWTEQPPMGSLHLAIFDSLTILFESEPFTYIMALFALVVIIGCFRVIVIPRL